MKISVVIPAYNEAKFISKTLDSLVKQKTAHNFEVILVDNDSTDDTVMVAGEFQKVLDLRILSEKNKGRSPARRTGFAAAKGEFIFSTDADTIVPENWIDEMMSNFSDQSIVAVTGSCKIHDSGWLINYFFNVIQPLSMKGYRIAFGHYWLSGFNFAIRKSAYIKSGGFNPELNSQEDTELSLRVNKLGKIKYVSKPLVTFSGRRFHQGLVKGLLEYISSWISVIVLKRHETILRDVR